MNIEVEKKRFGELLMTVDLVDWRTAVYLPVDIARWSTEIEALIANPDFFDEYDLDDNPEYMTSIGYKEILLSDDIAGVFKNAKSRFDVVDEDVMFKAFLFYYENDAYIPD
ncbi:DUF7716 domain-containing protein [Aliamphritea ceti]|uniref:DUF7716 domain-containing protein n=1 Tax=Aliamphritea ceti TaxID=1524258 RepID=UPI0021C2D250|nr:hypothetical protein [Aliamphritea ceti]